MTFIFRYIFSDCYIYIYWYTFRYIFTYIYIFSTDIYSGCGDGVIRIVELKTRLTRRMSVHHGARNNGQSTTGTSVSSTQPQTFHTTTSQSSINHHQQLRHFSITANTSVHSRLANHDNPTPPTTHHQLSTFLLHSQPLDPTNLYEEQL